MRALVAERDPLNAVGRIRALQRISIAVDTARSWEDAAEMARHFDYQVLVLGLALTDMPGLEALRRLRAERMAMPVVAMARSDDPAGVVAALDAGADDCIHPETDRAEFLARVRSVIRRANGHARSMLATDNLSLDIQGKEVLVEGRPLRLTSKEFGILELLVLRKGSVQSKEAILTHLYNGMDEPEGKIVDVFVCKIRRKLAEAGYHGAIATVWGRGYVLREAAEAPLRGALHRHANGERRGQAGSGA